MSLKKFIQSIANLFAGIFNHVLPEVKKAMHIAVSIVNNLKNFDTLHPEFSDILTAIIPGNLDDDIKNLLREKLPQVFIELKLVDATFNAVTPEEITAAAVAVIQQLSGDYRSATLNSLSIIIAQLAADNKLDWSDAVYLMKWYYDHTYKADEII